MNNDNEWRDSDTDDIRAIVHNTVEFVMVDRLSEDEVMALMQSAKRHKIHTNVSQSRRIITTAADYVDEATTLLAEAHVIDGIRLIKHITEYEIETV